MKYSSSHKKKSSKDKGESLLEPAFPMRINKYLAHEGYATRREADELIEKRLVLINGEIAVLGDKVNESDIVEVRNNKRARSYQYFVFNKPRGMMTEKIPAPRELSPILGLDAQAEGLVLFSNDRRLIERLTNSKHLHTKEYIIRTLGPLRQNFKEKMEQGVILEKGGRPIESQVKIKNERMFILKTTDNGNHIRHMCSMFFAEIESLTRIKILNLELGSLPSQENREIIGEELETFLSTLGLK